MVSEDKITIKRGDVSLILEPYGNKWSVSVIKNLPGTGISYGSEWLQTRIYPSGEDSYFLAKSDFLKGMDAICADELSFERVCVRTFGWYDPEYFTYKL